MAKPYYSFIHPSDGIRYFYITNTYYELPEIVPVDLATFIWYLFRTGKNLSPFAQIYAELIARGTSLADYSFDKLEEKEKQLVYRLVYNAGTNHLAIQNNDLCSKIDFHLQNQKEKLNKKTLTLLLRDSSFKSNRPISFFSSWSHTMNLLEELNLQDKILNLNELIYKEKECNLNESAESFLSLCESAFPATAIPHVLRKVPSIDQYLRSKNYPHLLNIEKTEQERIDKKLSILINQAEGEAILDLFNAVYSCSYGISNSIKKEIALLQKPWEEISMREKATCLEKELCNGLTLCNLIDSFQNNILPTIYYHVEEFKNTDFKTYGLYKYGIQVIDLISYTGKILFEDAYNIDFYTDNFFVIEDHYQKKSIYRYSNENDELYFVWDYAESYPVLFSENRIWYKGGFVNEDFEPCTPMCFDQDKAYHFPGIYFSEGLAPVCLNGKWGYINQKAQIIIPFKYGDALPFHEGKAFVFQLKKIFESPKGIWHEQPSSSLDKEIFNSSEEEFFRKFPDFPRTVRKPFASIRGIPITKLDLMMRYHCFAQGMQQFDYEKDSFDFSYFGEWICIDINGNIQSEKEINADLKHSYSIFKGDCSPLEKYIEADLDEEYWVEKIQQNIDAVRSMPDELFIRKEFVLKILRINPYSFKHFTILYSNDEDICSFALHLLPENYFHFSELLQDKLHSEYNYLINLTQPKNGEEDELPF